MLKYVIVRQFGLTIAVIGHEIMRHADMIGVGDQVIAAGFCTIGIVDGKLKVSTEGRSETLDVGSTDSDKDVIVATLTGRPYRCCPSSTSSL